MPALCTGGTLREASHPVLDWADANPERIAGLDLRPQLPAYRRMIREFVARRSLVRTR
jgi:hypothetical protein